MHTAFALWHPHASHRDMHSFLWIVHSLLELIEYLVHKVWANWRNCSTSLRIIQRNNYSNLLKTNGQKKTRCVRQCVFFRSHNCLTHRKRTELHVKRQQKRDGVCRRNAVRRKRNEYIEYCCQIPTPSWTRYDRQTATTYHWHRIVPHKAQHHFIYWKWFYDASLSIHGQCKCINIILIKIWLNNKFVYLSWEMRSHSSNETII